MIVAGGGDERRRRTIRFIAFSLGGFHLIHEHTLTHNGFKLSAMLWIPSLGKRQQRWLLHFKTFHLFGLTYKWQTELRRSNRGPVRHSHRLAQNSNQISNRFLFFFGIWCSRRRRRRRRCLLAYAAVAFFTRVFVL